MKFGKTVLASESATCKRNEFPRRSKTPQVAFVPGGEGGAWDWDNNGIGIRPREINRLNIQEISDCSKLITHTYPQEFDNNNLIFFDFREFIRWRETLNEKLSMSVGNIPRRFLAKKVASGWGSTLPKT